MAGKESARRTKYEEQHRRLEAKLLLYGFHVFVFVFRTIQGILDERQLRAASLAGFGTTDKLFGLHETCGCSAPSHLNAIGTPRHQKTLGHCRVVGSGVQQNTQGTPDL